MLTKMTEHVVIKKKNSITSRRNTIKIKEEKSEYDVDDDESSHEKEKDITEQNEEQTRNSKKENIYEEKKEEPKVFHRFIRYILIILLRFPFSVISSFKVLFFFSKFL